MAKPTEQDKKAAEFREFIESLGFEHRGTEHSGTPDKPGDTIHLYHHPNIFEQDNRTYWFSMPAYVEDRTRVVGGIFRTGHDIGSKKIQSQFKTLLGL